MRSEFEFLSRIRRRAAQRNAQIQNASNTTNNSSLITHHSSLTSHHSSLLQGIGDDAAVIEQQNGRDTVVTADLLVEEIDFRLAWTTPRLLGHKALAVSLSDTAAMGARPRFAMLSLGVPREIWSTDFLDEFYEGFFALAESYNVALIGGDVSRTPERIVIDSIVIGETAHGRAVLRAGARPGDQIFVTGTLGGAAAGLKLLEDGVRSQKKPRTREARAVAGLLLRQLRPEPRIVWGAKLGEENLATAMIDISDSLSSDLAHLCQESNVGALLEAAHVPLDPSLSMTGKLFDEPLALALNGGEDFELLFTVSPSNLERLPREVEGVQLSHIGEVTENKQLVMLCPDGHEQELKPAGFEHF